MIETQTESVCASVAVTHKILSKNKNGPPQSADLCLRFEHLTDQHWLVHASIFQLAYSFYEKHNNEEKTDTSALDLSVDGCSSLPVEIIVELPAKDNSFLSTASESAVTEIFHSVIQMIYYGCGVAQNTSDVIASFQTLSLHNCWSLVPKLTIAVGSGLKQSIIKTYESRAERFSMINSLAATEKKNDNGIKLKRSIAKLVKASGQNRSASTSSSRKDDQVKKVSSDSSESSTRAQVRKAEAEVERLRKLLRMKIDENEALCARVELSIPETYGAKNESTPSPTSSKNAAKSKLSKLSTKKGRNVPANQNINKLVSEEGILKTNKTGRELTPYMTRSDVTERFNRVDQLLSKINESVNRLLLKV